MTAERLGVPGVNNVSEAVQIARNLVLAANTGVHYHVCHVSTKESINLIRLAKAQGVNVTCEVTPHHLLLDDSMIVGDEMSQFKMNPPLRSPEDRLACVAGLMDGTIDMIATDHAPHTDAEKKQGILASPNGIVGSETAFALLYTKFVKTGLWPLDKLIDWMSGAPNDCFINEAGQQRWVFGHIAVFDLTRKNNEAKNFLSKGHNSPFLGESFRNHSLTVVMEKGTYRGSQIMTKRYLALNAVFMKMRLVAKSAALVNWFLIQNDWLSRIYHRSAITVRSSCLHKFVNRKLWHQF